MAPEIKADFRFKMATSVHSLAHPSLDFFKVVSTVQQASMEHNKVKKEEEHNKVKKEEKEGFSVQLLRGFSISLVALLQGASISSSSILHSLRHENPENFDSSTNSHLFDFDLDLAGSDFSITEEEDSWVASIWVLSHLAFAPVAGFVNDKIGRRRALMIDCLLLFLGFLILTLAPSLPWLVLARVLMGCPNVSQVQFLHISKEVQSCFVR